MTEKNEVKVDKSTGEVIENKKTAEENKNNIFSQSFQPFAYRNGSFDNSDSLNDDSSEPTYENDKKIFYPPMKVVRDARNKGPLKPGEIRYYDYATGLSVKIGERDVSFTLFFEPENTIGPRYEILNQIFGEKDEADLEVVKQTFTTIRRGRTSTSTSYTFRISGVDNEGFPVTATLKPIAKSSDIVENILVRLKGYGYID